MAVNYGFERGKYGCFPGTIIAFPRTLDGDNPNDTDFKNKLPAGFLRCDGSVLNGNDYPNLKDILGVGANSKFRKETQTLKETYKRIRANEYHVPSRVGLQAKNLIRLLLQV